MKKLSVLFLSLAALLAATVPLMAQVPDPGHIYVYPPIRLSNQPQNTPGPIGILPVQFKAAYGFNRIPNLGQGQTIAIVDAYDDPNIEADLAVYKAQFHLGPCNFQKVKVGNPTGNVGWGAEISLDVEQACALAPQSNIILVEAEGISFAELLPAVQVAYSSPYNANVISMSWGTPEVSGEMSYDSYFCNIVAGNGQPVTFFAAAGDAPHHVLYPSASPCVIAVGGTTLTLAQAAPLSNPLQLNYGAEIGWDHTGGGISVYESQMSWQNPACATWSTTNPCTPDIASVSANIPVYDTYGSGGWLNVDGTSIAAPDWAAFLTIVNSQRAALGKGTLSQAAYDLYQLYYSANYLTDFHDITTGSNGTCGSQCNAGPGYDLLTGIGTYQADNLITPLAFATN